MKSVKEGRGEEEKKKQLRGFKDRESSRLDESCIAPRSSNKKKEHTRRNKPPLNPFVDKKNKRNAFAGEQNERESLTGSLTPFSNYVLVWYLQRPSEIHSLKSMSLNAASKVLIVIGGFFYLWITEKEKTPECNVYVELRSVVFMEENFKVASLRFECFSQVIEFETIWTSSSFLESRAKYLHHRVTRLTEICIIECTK